MITFKMENAVESIAKHFGTKIKAQIIKPKNKITKELVSKIVFGKFDLKLFDPDEFLYIHIERKLSGSTANLLIFKRPTGGGYLLIKTTGGTEFKEYISHYSKKTSFSIEDVSVHAFEKKYWEYENSPATPGDEKGYSIHSLLAYIIDGCSIYKTPQKQTRRDWFLARFGTVEDFGQVLPARDETIIIHKENKLYYMYHITEAVKAGLYKLAWAPSSRESDYSFRAVEEGSLPLEDMCINKEEYNSNVYQRYVFYKDIVDDKYGNKVKRGCSFEECKECGKIFFPYEEEDKIRGRFGHRTMLIGANLCSDCFSNKYFVCDVCGYLLEKDKEHKTPEMDTQCCEICWKSNSIHRYFYNPKFKNLSKDKLYYGIELEVEGKTRLTQKAAGLISKYPKIYIKTDSSIRSGFEIITVPLENFYEPWIKTMLGDLRRDGFRSFQTDTCGMHVHVSSEPLTERNIQWLTEFFYQKNNSGFLKLMSERDIRLLIRWANLDKSGVGLLESSDIIARQKKEQGRVSHERHAILNLTKEHTVEFRMFRGTLKYESFLGNLEFVKSLIDSSEQIAPHYDSLVDYIGEKAGNYPNLISKMQRLKIIDSTLRLGRPIPPIFQAGGETPQSHAGFAYIPVEDQTSDPEDHREYLERLMRMRRSEGVHLYSAETTMQNEGNYTISDRTTFSVDDPEGHIIY